MNDFTPPKIGIVSGTGPLAGSDVYAKLLQQAAEQYGAVEDCEYPDTIMISRGIAGVDNTATLSDVFKQAIAHMVYWLEEQGATTIGIACNTAHLYLNQLKVNPHTNIVNLIDAVAQRASSCPERYLLLTSATSKRQKLYHPYLEKYGVLFGETDDVQQSKLDDAIGLVMSHKLNRAGELMESVLMSAKSMGFSALIAGCTELPIALDHANNRLGLKIIDSNKVLGHELIAHYYQKM